MSCALVTLAMSVMLAAPGSTPAWGAEGAKRAGADWWALQPVVRPQPPAVKDARWVRQPIDAFVLARLEAQGLHPSPQADRRTLIRRLSFDLLGLPPTPEQVDAFEADDSPQAYERLVQSMLDSPQYGQRWARHWLDVARFGESQGFERDKLRQTSWRYRDWVVDALNRDMPYDEFARLQLAGDVLRPGDAQGVIATGFLVAGAYDEVGQQQQSAAMRAIVRQDELEDVVSVVGQTFLGLTIHCARCHDHKFDPVKQEEYYRLASALGGVRHGERDVSGEAVTAEARRLNAALSGHIDQIDAQITAITLPVRQHLLAEAKAEAAAQAKAQAQGAARSPAPTPIAQWDFTASLEERSNGWHATLVSGAQRGPGGLAVDGRGSFAASTPITKTITAKTLEAWVRLSDLAQRGGGAISIQKLDGSVFDAIVFGEREPGRWMAGSDNFKRTASFNAPAETEADKRTVHVAIVYDQDGTIRGYRNGRPYGQPYKSNGPATFNAGEAQVVFGLRHLPAGGNHNLAGVIQRARLYDRALSAGEVAASAGVSGAFVTEDQVRAALSPAQVQRIEQLRLEINQLRDQQKRVAMMKVYAVTPRQPEPTHLLERGNPAAPAQVVTPGGVAALVGLDADFGLAPDAPEGQRRVKLAGWITDPANPLFARVIVNRLWHYHFGEGLVQTPSDFGFNGSRPSHPMLIDWLASELVRQNWSLKKLHRAMVMSATYRQSSRSRAEAMAVDAGNRLLWRMSPRRLEAEAIHDAMLAAAGQLNTDVGGPGYYDFTTFTSNTQFYEPIDPVGVAFNRRALYRTWVRSGRNRFLDVFDCPDPSTKSPRRAVTNTPLSALVLSNNSFTLRMADALADRLKRDAGDSVDAQIDRAFKLLCGRGVEQDELPETRAFIGQHGLAAFCRVMFNLSEFVHVQ